MIGAGGYGVASRQQAGSRHGTSLLSQQPTPHVRPTVPQVVLSFRHMGRKDPKTKNKDKTDTPTDTAAAPAAAAAAAAAPTIPEATGVVATGEPPMATAVAAAATASAAAEADAEADATVTTDDERLDELWVGEEDGKSSGNGRGRSRKGGHDPALENLKEEEFVKGLWTPQEDEMLLKAVEKYGVRDWVSVEKQMLGRRGKQCRERYFNHLAPEIVKTPWTPEEDRIIMETVQKMGNKWTYIATLLPQKRAPNAIKNRWNATLKRRVPPLVLENEEQARLHSQRSLKDAAARAAAATNGFSIYLPQGGDPEKLGATATTAAGASAPGAAGAVVPDMGAYVADDDDDAEPQFILLCHGDTETPVCTYPVTSAGSGPQIVYGFPSGAVWPYPQAVTLVSSLPQQQSEDGGDGKDKGAEDKDKEGQAGMTLFVSTNAQGPDTHRVVALAPRTATAFNTPGETGGESYVGPLFPAAAAALAKAPAGGSAAGAARTQTARKEREAGGLLEMVIVQRMEDKPTRVALPHTRNGQPGGGKCQFPVPSSPSQAPSGAAAAADAAPATSKETKKP